MQGGSFAALLKNPKRRVAWENALVEACELIRPAAIWESFPIRETRHERLVLANGTRIGGGPVATVIGGAEDLVIGITTVGPLITQRITALQQEHRLFDAMLLGDLASWAVDQIRQQLCRLIEREATDRGLHASTSLSPGESEWSVKEQGVLFSLLDASPIGVTLRESMVMDPLKSLSLIIGTGRQPIGVEGGSNCDFCSIRERCAHRKLRDPN